MKILKFSASWCVPCKQLAQTINSLHPEQKSIFEDVDVDAAPKELLAQYNVRAVPTLVVLNDDGGVMRTITGNQTKKQLEALFIND